MSGHLFKKICLEIGLFRQYFITNKLGEQIIAMTTYLVNTHNVTYVNSPIQLCIVTSNSAVVKDVDISHLSPFTPLRQF